MNRPLTADRAIGPIAESRSTGLRTPARSAEGKILARAAIDGRPAFHLCPTGRGIYGYNRPFRACHAMIGWRMTSNCRATLPISLNKNKQDTIQSSFRIPTIETSFPSRCRSLHLHCRSINLAERLLVGTISLVVLIGGVSLDYTNSSVFLHSFVYTLFASIVHSSSWARRAGRRQKSVSHRIFIFKMKLWKFGTSFHPMASRVIFVAIVAAM